MFQDSVPAGSYNDPFLSSVCLSLSLSLARSLYLLIFTDMAPFSSLSALPVGHDRATKGAGCWEAQH